jgi:hypothetical protein
MVRDFQAELLIRFLGDRLAEGCVHSAIAREGAKVHSETWGLAPNGSREHKIVFSFNRYQSLDEIVRQVSEVRGAVVTAVTLLHARAPLGRAEEAL